MDLLRLYKKDKVSYLPSSSPPHNREKVNALQALASNRRDNLQVLVSSRRDNQKRLVVLSLAPHLQHRSFIEEHLPLPESNLRHRNNYLFFPYFQSRSTHKHMGASYSLARSQLLSVLLLFHLCSSTSPPLLRIQSNSCHGRCKAGIHNSCISIQSVEILF